MNPDGIVPWPEPVAARYRAAGCWRGRPLGAYLCEWAKRDGVALVDGDRRWTYRELAAEADRLAERLAGLGLRGGDAVLLQLPNCGEFVLTILACLRLGVVPAMMLPSHRDHELGAIGAHVDAAAVIVPGRWRGYDHEALAHRVAAALPGQARVLVSGGATMPGGVDLLGLPAQDEADGEVTARRERLDRLAPDAESVALLLLSGGTTGVPKVIGRTHDDYEYNIRQVSAACGFGPDTVYLAVLPAGHNFPLANPGILGTLQAGGRVVLLASPRPEAAFAAVERERVTVTSVVPAVAMRWMESAVGNRHDLSSLRHVQVGGAPLAPEVAAQIGPALGCGLQQVYGMAEGLVCYTRPGDPDAVVHGTQGTPISPYDELLVVDADEVPVAPGEAGELWTRGPYTPRGYYGVPEQNRVCFTPAGWYRTGDLVRILADGQVVVCGRVKDLINRGGEKIAAAEVETLAQELPAVAEAAAVPMADPEVGERVCLFVRLRPGHTLTLDDVAVAFRGRGVAAFKVPERLVVLDDLPHTPVGKPDKVTLGRLVAVL